MIADVLASESSPSVSKGQSAETKERQHKEKELRFSIWEFHITGNTLLDPRLLEKAVYPYLGTDKTIEDVDAAVVALQTLFKNSGYPTVLVNVPQQDVSEGIVQLYIIQGKIGRLEVSGSRYFSLNRIKNSMPALAVDEVPYLPDVQDQLQTLNASNPDLTVTPIFRPGRTPGTVAVDLRVKDQNPFHGSLELNGRNTAGTTRTRLIASASYGNLWLKSHSVSLTYQTSPEDTDEVRVLVGTYVLPVSDDNDRLALYALRSDSETGVATGGAISVVGKGTIAGARWVNMLRSETRYFHSLVLGADYKDFDEVIGLEDADSLTTPISYTIFSFEYNATTLGLSNTASFSGGIHFAPRALGNNEIEFENKRFEANPNFAYLSADLRDEYVFETGIRLRGAITGQLANQALVSNEQFSVGGAESVRGYYESQILADDALRASIELQAPDFESLTARGFKEFHVKAFIDGGISRIHEPLPDIDVQEEIIGTGVGLRIATRKSFFLAADVAYPLKDNRTVEKGDVRVHFLLRGAF